MDITFAYYKKRNGEDYVVPKQVINTSINPYDSSTYLPHLENMNYPYIIEIWEQTREYCAKNNMLEKVFPKYISKMNLQAYKKFTWKDNEFLNNSIEEKNKILEACHNIQKYISLYILGELTFEEAFDKACPHYEKLFTIRYKEIIDNLVDYKKVVSENEINGSFEN